MCRCRRSQSKCAWAKAKVRQSFGSYALSPAASCSRSTAFPSMSPRKRWGLPRPSYRSKPVSSNVSPSDVMKVADVRAMTRDQLDDEVLKLKKEQFNLRFQRATGQLENTARVRIIRRDIARMKTIAAQKRAGAPEPAPRAETGAPAPEKKTRTAKAKAAAKPKSRAKSKSKTKSKE